MKLSRVSAGLAASVLAYPVALYIRSQRDRLALRSVPLTDHTKKEVSEYFRSVDLDRVRAVERDPLPVPAPPFRQLARRLGLDFPELSMVAAITLDDVIASRGPLAARLLFHELVHVVQFRLLGIHTFSKLYTRGLLSTRSYHRIPLERCAFELEERFATANAPFDVESTVAMWIENDLF